MDRDASPLEQRASNAASPRVRRALAALAAVFGALAVFTAFTVAPARDGARLDVTPLQLAQWIRDQKEGLRVIDVRSSSEVDGPLIPTAEAIDLNALTTTAFRADDTIVLYSTEDVHADQAWVLLRARGYRRLFFLRGGWPAWHEEVMHPALEEGASAEAQTAFARAAALSRYFGGLPRIVPGRPGETREPAPAKTETPAQPSPPRRRGC